jgi:hypothetical protein
MMRYERRLIEDRDVPRAAEPRLQHLIDTYASETNKTASVFFSFDEKDLAFRPHARSSTVLEIMKHQLLSERRFFAEFVGTPEPGAAEVLPSRVTPSGFAERLGELARARLAFLSEQTDGW